MGGYHVRPRTQRLHDTGLEVKAQFPRDPEAKDHGFKFIIKTQKERRPTKLTQVSQFLTKKEKVKDFWL